ncbi:MAG: MBL fold metallo-hydrolase [Methylacidiphilales bacterium]|nr:MBL fold metallo-hydrolase [Candidatus Methylacidiphilales bacterium]
MNKKFASHADTEEKNIHFTKLSDRAYAYTAEGDPNTGIIIGDKEVLVIDTQATPIMAQDVIARVAGVTDKPIRHVLLTHYHAVRVLGASAYSPVSIIASQPTFELICERGEQDYKSEVGRFPRLFRGVDSVPGLTWPTHVFSNAMKFFMGKTRVDISNPGRGHTKGDTIAWLEQERILFSGDLVEYGATPYSGDAYHRDWPSTLDKLLALQPEMLVPGRGEAVIGKKKCIEAIEGTREFVQAMFSSVEAGKKKGKSLSECYIDAYTTLAPKYKQWVIFEHCLPFDITRCFDEAGNEYPDPRIWTDSRDQDMWHSLQSALDTVNKT